jgi:hypothetical protein
MIIMNNTFNIKRFGLAFRKDIFENGKRYILLFITLLGLITFINSAQTFNYYKYGNHQDALFHNKNLLSFLSIMFMVAGIWFASTFANLMNSKLKRISYLVSPASNLEKYLTRWIITTIGFIVVFFVAFWIADALRVAIASFRFPGADIKFLDITKLINSENEPVYEKYVVPKSVFMILLSNYFLLQSTFLLGSTFWEKASFIKTFSFLAAIIAVFILICRWTILLFYGGELEGYLNVWNSFEIDQIMSEQQALLIAVIFMAVFTVIFWVLAFFRIRESEIINRI